jgi:hypothetical protein
MTSSHIISTCMPYLLSRALRIKQAYKKWLIFKINLKNLDQQFS